jgi:hypothetical protein
MKSSEPLLRQSRESPIHIVDICPVCDQEIPNDKAGAVHERLKARERQLTDAARAAAAQQIATERAQIEAVASAAIEKARKESADAVKSIMDQAVAREAAAHAAGKNEADTALQEKLAIAERAIAEANATSTERITALQHAARISDAEWQEKMSALELAANGRVAVLEQEALGRDAAWQGRIVELESAANGRIAALEQAAQGRDAEWQEKMSTLESAANDRIAALELAAQGRDVEWQEKIVAAEHEKQKAMTQLEELKAEQANAIDERVREVREAMEKDKSDALNAERSKHAENQQRLTGKLELLTRQLERKTAEELGEGAEVQLFDALRAEFDEDNIERVGKGLSGADIIHTVRHNGHDCGTIIYDSKNSTAWRDDYVTKLVQDQTAAKADYAVLSTFKFPAGTKQVEVRDSVIIVNPARAVAIAQIIRRQLVQVFVLRLSKSERSKKMAALFDYITSPRCQHLLERIDSHAEALQKLQEKEMKAHQAHWGQEGTLIRSIQKVKAELENEIDSIIGISELENDCDET